MAPAAAPAEARPASADSATSAAASPPRGTVTIPAGAATLGADRAAIPFGWDNEFGEHRVDVDAFEIDVHNVTNAEFLEFIDAGGYRTRDAVVRGRLAVARSTRRLTHPAFWVRDGSGWRWRGMFENIELAAVVAGVCQPRGSGGVRALARPAAAD